MIGVDYDLFWRLNPKSLSPFIKAFRLRQEYDDHKAWNLGAYIRVAIGSSMSKDVKYPKKPNMSKKSDGMDEQEYIKNKFLNKMNELNRRFSKED